MKYLCCDEFLFEMFCWFVKMLYLCRRFLGKADTLSLKPFGKADTLHLKALGKADTLCLKSPWKNGYSVSILLIFTKMITRSIESRIREHFCSSQNALFLTGARQVGKTSVVHKFAAENEMM